MSDQDTFRGGWLITADFLSDDKYSAVGTAGPSTIGEGTLHRLQSGEGQRFALYDDDGELMYHGRILEADECVNVSGDPLLNWGEGYAGATLMTLEGEAYIG